MFLVADSGSTKTDWLVLNNKGEVISSYITLGYNPLIVDSDFIFDDLMNHADIRLNASKITHVYFYGAGCSSPHLNIIIADALKRIYVHAEIIVDHDLLASALASYDGYPVVCAILGTGSNACFYDGENLTQTRPALGYLLGDEGSGSYFGKILLKSFLYKRLKSNLHSDFIDQYKLDKHKIFASIYKADRPNTYLASFMPFFAKHRKHPQINNWLINGFDEFIKTHVVDYPINKVNFIGSIGYYFKEELEIVCQQNGLELLGCDKEPIHRLAKSIYKYLYTKTNH